MQRLTTRNSMGVAILKTPYQCKRCGEEIYRLQDQGNGDPVEKLAEYEDLEEQGKLLKPPCIVECMLYRPNEYQNRVEYHSVRKIKIDSNGIWIIDTSGHVYDPDDFGKIIFLTKKEAEEALKEKRANGAD